MTKPTHFVLYTKLTLLHTHSTAFLRQHNYGDEYEFAVYKYKKYFYYVFSLNFPYKKGSQIYKNDIKLKVKFQDVLVDLSS